MKYIITLFILVLLGLIILSGIQTQKFNNWIIRCTHDGGTVQLTGIHIFSNSYECYKDGKIINHVN